MSGATRNLVGDIISLWYSPVRFTAAATLAGVLTNEMHRVPCDPDGNNGNYTGAESALVIYEGSENVSSQFLMGYTPSAGLTVDAATFAATNVVKVTDMSVDAGYVDLQGTRLGTTIIKRFSISKSRQGDSTPSYSLTTSTLIVLVKPDLSRNPESITVNARWQTGLDAPQDYEGIFKFYVDGFLWYENQIPVSSYTWDGFNPLFPSDTLFPSLTLKPFPVYTGEVDLRFMTVELWDSSNTTLLDSQSVLFMADWSNYVDDILQDVPDYVPRYLGIFEQELPPEYIKAATWLIYGKVNTPYNRGVYLYDGTQPVR
jgi:hypothetical protein